MASSVRQDLDRAMADQQKRRAQQNPSTQRQPARQLEKPKDGDILGKIAHPLAYAFDQAWGDISSPLPKEWEHETTVPPPDDLVSRTLGEGMRGLFDIGALFLTHKAGKGAVEKFVKPRIVKQVRRDVRQQMKRRKAKKPRAAATEEVSITKPKQGGGVFELYVDQNGVKYTKMTPAKDGRARFRRQSDKVVFIQRANGKFIPEHPTRR